MITDHDDRGEDDPRDDPRVDNPLDDPRADDPLDDPLVVARRLLAAASVTPDDGGCLSYLRGVLEAQGFSARFLPFGPGDRRVGNLVAWRGLGRPRLAFAGHVDVVPPGPPDLWRHPPFSAALKDGRLYGRGAVDMKGAIAAFVAACGRVAPRTGSLWLLLTADEEGPAEYGTRRLVTWLRRLGLVPDMCLVGEPSSEQAVGDTVKIGRRGSLSGHLTALGRRGHVAYPEDAINAAHALTALLGGLLSRSWDEGSAHFTPSGFQISRISCDSGAGNVIPERAECDFNIRFNDCWTHETLGSEVRARLDASGWAYDLALEPRAAPFVTPLGPWSELVAEVITKQLGRAAIFSTSGGTSDARFLKEICPTVELGLRHECAHQVDESVTVAELELLTGLYAAIIARALG